MRINHNIAALNTYHQLSLNNLFSSKSLEKLSSGMRINRASDDAAGLAVSEKMRQQVRGISVAIRNAQDAISLIQTAEGAMGSIHSILQRMRELAVQAANDTNTDEDRAAIQEEIEQLKAEIDRICDTTEFNTRKLLDGSNGATTTAADITGGQAVTVSSAAPVQIFDGQETANNVLAVTYNADATTKYDLLIQIEEGNYNDPVAFTKAFNDALQAAAAQYEALNGISIASDVAKFSLGFNINVSDGKITFYLQADSSVATTQSLTVKKPDNPNALTYALGLTAASVTVTGVVPPAKATADFNTVSKNADGTQDFVWGTNDFTLRLEDGLNPEAGQNNILRMTYDGLSITAYIAEGDYTDPSALEKAVLNAIVGVDVVSTAFTNLISTPNAANWATLLSAAKTYGSANAGDSVPTGLIAAVNSMTQEELNALGYRGNEDDMKAAYLKDLYTYGGETLAVAFNSDNKLTVSGPALMSVDETSPAASVLGLVDVNLDISQQGITVHIGANANQTVAVSINDLRTHVIGETEFPDGATLYVKDVDLTTAEGAEKAIQVLDAAITAVSAERSRLGAMQNRLEHTINNLSVASENLTAAESRIRDVDMALEMMEFTKNNILQQASTAMLAQANQQPQLVLQLLGR